MLKSLTKKDLNKDYTKHLYALILAGGGGTRLWPRSRNATPKQFLKLFNNKTLTQITFERFRKILPAEKIFCVTVSEDYKKEIVKEVPDFIKENIIVEPARRETGPAHALGAYVIYHKDPDAVIVTESADRLVSPIERYLEVLKAAAEVAYSQKVLIALGVEPRYPHTGLGHIKKGEKYCVITDVSFFKLDKFVEKPELELAKKYTESGEYYWNAGEFVWRADTLLTEIEKHSPDIYKNLIRIKDFGSIAKIYEDMPTISIDYAVAEKSNNFVVVYGDFSWTDIGDWKEVWEKTIKDSAGNVIIDGDAPGGEIVNIDTVNSLIHKDGRMIAVVGLTDIVIVDTHNALLVCSKAKSQSVKKVVEYLKEKEKKELL